MRTRLWLLAVAAVLAVGVSVPAAHAQYPPTGPTFTLMDSAGHVTTSFEPGEAGGLMASGLLGATTYNTLFHQSPGRLLSSAVSTADGHLQASFRIPDNAHVGAATLTVEAGSDVHSLPISIVRDTGAAAGAQLPRTGQEIERMVFWAAILIVVGALLVTAARKRRSRVTARS